MINDGKDVGFWHDFISYLQHIGAAEHHALESFCETGDKTYFELNKKLRTMRSHWMYKHIPTGKGQLYCETKHLAIVAQNLKEMSNRYVEENDIVSAEKCLKESQEIEAIIILLNTEKKEKKNFTFFKSSEKEVENV
jgi:hypothetical protein